MRQVYFVGIGHTGFGNLSEYELVDIMGFAGASALEDAGILDKRDLVEQVFVANMASAHLNRQTAVASALVSALCLEPAMAEVVENGPASGLSAIKVGYMAIASGMVDCALVVGGEIMRGVTGWEATDVVASMLHPRAEYDYGLTLPSFGGMFTRLYMEKYGLTERELAMVAVKDHRNGALNPFAHVKVPCTLEAIADSVDINSVSPYVAEPLRIYNMCPVSDGAAAVLLCAADSAKMKHFTRKKPIRLAGIGSATDTHCVHNRKDPLELNAVRLAAERAYKMAGVGPEDISFAELHDAFVILELAISEEVGFFPRGKGIEGVKTGSSCIDGARPINTSGGLKAKGHPVGATGVSMAFEVVKQLRGEGEKGRQVKDPKFGMAVNFGGFGNNVAALICAKE